MKTYYQSNPNEKLFVRLIGDDYHCKKVELYFDATIEQVAEYALNHTIRAADISRGFRLPKYHKLTDSGHRRWMNVETGSVDDYDGWGYQNEDGRDVNAVDLGEVIEVVQDAGAWVEV